MLRNTVAHCLQMRLYVYHQYFNLHFMSMIENRKLDCCKIHQKVQANQNKITICDHKHNQKNDEEFEVTKHNLKHMCREMVI